MFVSTADFSLSLFIPSGPRSGLLGTQNQDKYLPEAFLAPALAKCLFKWWDGNFQNPWVKSLGSSWALMIKQQREPVCCGSVQKLRVVHSRSMVGGYVLLMLAGVIWPQRHAAQILVDRTYKSQIVIVLGTLPASFHKPLKC